MMRACSRSCSPSESAVPTSTMSHWSTLPTSWAGRRFRRVEFGQSRQPSLDARHVRPAQDLVWDKDPNVLIASSFIFPAGRARKVDGGYRLNGSWPFSSGSAPANGTCSPASSPPHDEADGIEYRIFLLHKDDYKINDTWNARPARHRVERRRGQGRLVPRRMTIAVAISPAGDTGQRGQPERALCAAGVLAVSLRTVRRRAGKCAGLPRRLCRRARHRVSTYNRAKLSDLQSTQMKMRKPRQDRRRAPDHALELHRGDGRRAAWPHSGYGGQDRTARDGAFSVNLCTEAVSLLFAASGARGLFTSACCSASFAMPMR